MDKFVKISVLENSFQAQLLESILQERSIPHLLKSYHDIAYGNIFQMHKGWGAVHAPEKFKEEIVEIIEELKRGYTWEES